MWWQPLRLPGPTAQIKLDELPGREPEITQIERDQQQVANRFHTNLRSNEQLCTAIEDK